MADPFAGMNPDLAARLKQIIALSGGKVRIVSGTRSVQRQQQLWDKAVAKYGSAKAARKWVAPPGKSNHNKGMAVDIGGDLALAAQLAQRVGLYRPMKHEPWHFEPAGHRGEPASYTTPPDVDAAAPGPTAAPLDPMEAIGEQMGNLMSLFAGPKF